MITAAEFRPTVLFYHHPCSDGFTAAWAASRYDPNIRLIPYDHGTGVPSNLVDERVVMIDCCFPREELLRLRGLSKDLLVLDHHQSSAKACGDLPFCHFEQNRSGAGLAWSFFFPQEPPPLLVQYVQDQDLHTRSFDETRDFMPAVYSREPSLDWWEYLAGFSKENAAARQELQQFLEKGAALREHFSHLMDEMIARSFSASLFGYRVRCANAPFPFHSAVANRLAYTDPSLDFAVTFAVDLPTRVRVSLRSRANGMALDDIAVKLGGGGHAHAAGTIMSPAAFFELLKIPDQGCSMQ